MPGVSSVDNEQSWWDYEDEEEIRKTVYSGGFIIICFVLFQGLCCLGKR